MELNQSHLHGCDAKHVPGGESGLSVKYSQENEAEISDLLNAATKLESGIS